MSINMTVSQSSTRSPLPRCPASVLNPSICSPYGGKRHLCKARIGSEQASPPPALRIKPFLIWLLASPLPLPCACHVSAQWPLSAPQICQAQDPPQAIGSFSVLSAWVQPPLSGSVSALEPFSSTPTQADFSGPVGRGPTEASFAFTEQIRSCSK